MRPQNAAPTPASETPDAVTTNVTTAASLPPATELSGAVSAEVSAAVSAAPSAPSNANPATASISTGGARTTSAVATPEPRPSSAIPAPAVTDAIQRRSGSGWASGPAASAALIAARLIAWPPNGAARALPRPVVTSAGRSGGRYP